ncbi:hypothetical protein [Labrys wisconsinensis]|uniref:Uncharacterized protein n=1 Tax=Labrys wisconsinensis TaxID=425677 RepID=A0ABU0JNL5_9HYPH|nr:hypothetical protein [Labrys wisconsinensis]MDQ0475096.1 hypothetical protein [Labrys wisconsinensis]
MVHIISKRDGPRREDVAARRFIQSNRATIEGLADRLTGGRWREMRKPPAPPQPEASGRLWFTPPAAPQPARPYLRISPNGRVVVMDLASGRQLQFLGQIGGGRERRFVLALREHGFFDPLDEDLRAALADLDGMALPDEAAEDRLKESLSARLGLEAPGNPA